MQKLKTLSRTPIFDYNGKLYIERHEVALPDGRTIPDWLWIESPRYINVLAVTEEDKFICFRQTKYGLDGISMAPVGGYIENDEDPLEAAKRELLEETGYEATKWMTLGEFRVDPNCGISMGYLFLALDAHYTKLPNSDDVEEQELMYLSQSDLEAALIAGEFKAMAWTALVALSLAHINRTSEQ